MGHSVLRFFFAGWQWTLLSVELISLIGVISSIVWRITKKNRLYEITELAGFAYDPSNGYFFSLRDAWQRKWGHCQLYDDAMPICGFVVECEPIRFKYEGKSWLIEFWKGQYCMATGAEIGVYYTQKNVGNSDAAISRAFYSCVKDEDMLLISFRLIKDHQVLIHRSDTHWWLAGFAMGEFSEISDLKMHIRIEFPKEEMRDVFVKELESIGYQFNEDYYTEGNAVVILYDKPYTKQPVTVQETAISLQQCNRELVESYQELTKNIPDTEEKLNFVKEEDLRLYKNAARLAKPPDIFKMNSAVWPYSFKEIKRDLPSVLSRVNDKLPDVFSKIEHTFSERGA